jgi:hypothetical protein
MASERDPTPDLRGALKPVLVQHMAAITDPKRVGELLRPIESYKGMRAASAAWAERNRPNAVQYR